MVRFRDGAGRLARHGAADAVAHRLVGLPVAAGGERVAVGPVRRVPLRVPIAAAHAGDQGRTDAIALDGERVIRIGDVEVLDPGEHELAVGGTAGREGNAVEGTASHGVPDQVQPPNHRGDIALDRSHGWRRREGVRFPDTEVGRPHRLDDLVRHRIPTDVAEGAGETTGDRAVAAGEEAGQQIRRVGHEGERRPRIDRMAVEEPGRAGDQRGGRTERAHPVHLHDVPGCRHRGADFQQGRVVEQGRDAVAPPRRRRRTSPS